MRPSSRVRPLCVDLLGPSADGRKTWRALGLGLGPPWSLVFNGGKLSGRFDSLAGVLVEQTLAATPDDEGMSLARGSARLLSRAGRVESLLVILRSGTYFWSDRIRVEGARGKRQ